MNYSFMSFSCPDMDLKQLLQTARRYGYAGIEPRLGSGHQHGIELDASDAFLLEARDMANDNNVSLCCLATSCTFADPDQAQLNVDVARRTIEVAAKIHAPAIRVFGGRIPDHVSRETSLAYVVDALGQLADDAAQHQVTICLETHDSWCDPVHVAAIMRQVNHPFVAVNWDIMHPVLTAGATVETAYALLQPWIRHVHVHDGQYTDNILVFKPIGEGLVDHEMAIRLLQDDGYTGFISGEWINWEPCDSHLPREIKKLQAFEKR